jgi:chromosomal replication initiator protein
VADLLSQRRSRSIARPRQIAMAPRQGADLTLACPRSAMRSAAGDHTTVIHACKRIKELRDTDQRMREDYSNLLRTLTG